MLSLFGLCRLSELKAVREKDAARIGKLCDDYGRVRHELECSRRAAVNVVVKESKRGRWRIEAVADGKMVFVSSINAYYATSDEAEAAARKFLNVKRSRVV